MRSTNQMNEKLPAPCEACRGSGLRHGAVCSECQGKGYRLFVNGHQNSGATAKSAAMATPSPGAEPSAFPLIVRPLPAAMSKQSTKPIPRDLATAFCEAVLSYQDSNSASRDD